MLRQQHLQASTAIASSWFPPHPLGVISSCLEKSALLGTTIHARLRPAFSNVVLYRTVHLQPFASQRIILSHIAAAAARPWPAYNKPQQPTPDRRDISTLILTEL